MDSQDNFTVKIQLLKGFYQVCFEMAGLMEKCLWGMLGWSVEVKSPQVEQVSQRLHEDVNIVSLAIVWKGFAVLSSKIFSPTSLQPRDFLFALPPKY